MTRKPADVSLYDFSYQTIAGLVTLPIEVDCERDNPFKVAKLFCELNHLYDNKVKMQMAEGLTDFITVELRKRLIRAQSEIQLLQSVYTASNTETSSTSHTSYYEGKIISQLREENDALRNIVSLNESGGKGLEKSVLLLTNKVSEERRRADLFSGKLEKLSEQIGENISVDQVLEKVHTLRSSLANEAHINRSLRADLKFAKDHNAKLERESSVLKSHIGAAIETMSDSSLSIKLKNAEDKLASTQATLMDERHSRMVLERTDKQRRGYTHKEVAQWAINRRRGKLQSHGFAGYSDHVLTAATSSPKGAANLHDLKNMLSQTKWLVDDWQWKNAAEDIYLMQNKTGRYQYVKGMATPRLIGQALSDMRWFSCQAVWQSKIQGMNKEGLVKLAANFAADLEQMHGVIERLEISQGKQQARTSDSRRHEQYGVGGASIHNRALMYPNAPQNAGNKSIIDGLDKNVWSTWANEKHEIHKKNEKVVLSLQEEVASERQRSESLSDEIATELYKVLAVWQSERERRKE